MSSLAFGNINIVASDLMALEFGSINMTRRYQYCFFEFSSLIAHEFGAISIVSSCSLYSMD